MKNCVITSKNDQNFIVHPISAVDSFFQNQINVKNRFYYFRGNLGGEGMVQKIVHNL